jgi:hypothetical protein
MMIPIPVAIPTSRERDWKATSVGCLGTEVTSPLCVAHNVSEIDEKLPISREPESFQAAYKQSYLVPPRLTLFLAIR